MYATVSRLKRTMAARRPCACCIAQATPNPIVEIETIIVGTIQVGPGILCLSNTSAIAAGVAIVSSDHAGCRLHSGHCVTDFQMEIVPFAPNTAQGARQGTR